MKKEDKGLVISNIAETIKEYGCYYVVETCGLDAEKTSALRRECFKNDVKLLVVKNKLLIKALESMGVDYLPELEGALHGSSSLMCANTGNAPAKLIKSFRKKDDVLPRLKAAYVEETLYVGEDQLETLANIKSKNELIADVLALLQSPAKNVISALQSGGNTIHGILETLSKKEA